MVGGREYQAEVSALRIEQRETEVVELTVTEANMHDYVLKATAVQDLADPTSLWRAVWDNPGSTATITIYPYGPPALATVAMSGTVRLKPTEGDVFGGDADSSLTRKQTFDFEWPFLDRPVLVEV